MLQTDVVTVVVLAVVDALGVVDGEAGVVEILGVVDGAAGVVEGAFGVVLGAAGVVEGAFGVVLGAAGVVESCRFDLPGLVHAAVTVTCVAIGAPEFVLVEVTSLIGTKEEQKAEPRKAMRTA